MLNSSKAQTRFYKSIYKDMEEKQIISIAKFYIIDFYLCKSNTS